MRDRSNWLSSVFRNPLSGLEPSWRQALQTPAVSALVALLLMQLVAALVLAGKALDQQAGDALLLTFEPAEVTRIEVLGTDQDVVLERGADGWILPALDGFPANADKVEQLLQRLTALGRPLPVGTSPETQDRLKVADQNAETRLVLSSDDGELTTLLLGDSPGFRRLYARLAGDSEVYDLPLASFEIASDSDDWARRDQLRLDPETIQRITTNGWALSRVETGWRLEDNRDQTPRDSGSGSGTEPQPGLDLDAIDQLLSRLANLSYQGVRTPTSETASPAASAEPVLAIEISLTNGETHQRTVYADSDGGFLLETGAEPLRYELSEYDLDGLLGLEPEQLIAASTDALSDTDAPSSEAATTADVEAPTGKPPVEQTTEGEPTEQGPHETDETAAEADAVAASSPAPSPADEAESAVTASPTTKDPAATTSEPIPGPGAGPESASPSTKKPESEPAAASGAGATPTKEVARQPSAPAPAPARGAPPPWPYPRYAPQNRPPWPPQGPPQNAPPQQAPPGWR